MDIFIKSFNRPYNLDRCIFSVRKFVENYSSIIILDDGTPQKYLEKIQEKYPEVVIKKSEFYEEKSTAIETDTVTRQKLKFPGEFWHREISKGSDYFLLLEDDFFIINPIDLTNIVKFMKEEKIFQYKLLWQGRKEFRFRKIKRNGNNELIVTENSFFSSENFRRLSYNKYRIRHIVTKLLGKTAYFKYFILPFYKYYTVAAAVLDKSLFMEMWKGVDNLDEFTQIYRMLKFYEDSSISLKVGKAVIESVETTYLTSATNEFKSIDLSIFQVNKVLNEAWLNGELDSTYRFPQDYGIEYLKKFLPLQMQQPYVEWVKEFAQPYINLGCRAVIY